MAPLFIGLLFWTPTHVVCIDPGHPSEVGQGTTGRHLSEMHANWVEAKLLKKRLEARGVKVVMTKNSEKEFVRNKARAEIANRAHADFMVRLHCDSESGTGFTCYWPSHPGTIDGFRGPTPHMISESGRLARVFHDGVANSLGSKLKDNGLKGDDATAVGHQHGALVGSIYSKVPVVLIEMVVLTNSKDESFLASSNGQNAMADALAVGVFDALGMR